MKCLLRNTGMQLNLCLLGNTGMQLSDWLISFYFSVAISILGLFTIPFGWLMPTLIDFIL